MRKYILILLAIAFFADLSGQQNNENLSGQVSYVTSGNVYVKFRSTDGITAGDTLYTLSNGNLVPFLIVNNLSSTSCVCTPVLSAKPAVADFVSAKVKATAKKSKQPAEAVPVAAATVATTVQSSQAGAEYASPQTALKQHISGSLSVNSYSDFSNTVAPSSQRFRYSLSLDAKNIGNSKFSFETYTSFRHKTGSWDEVKSNIFNALKIYNLAVIYDPNKTTRISLGRRINPRLSNIGASDGIQVEKSFGSFAMGALVGTRPDYEDYGFNSKLLQFGGYLGVNTKKQNKFSETSVAFMQQMNGSNIDRRFVYFQHSNSIIKNLYFIGTLEADLYKLTVDTVAHTEKASGTFDLTGVYLSLRYRLSDRFSVSGSYDARKNVIYYETYKTYVDRLLEDQMRQGYRLQMSYRFTRELTFGLQGGYRFLKSDPKPSKNIYGYFTYSNVPGIKSSLTVSGTYLESSYMNGKIYSAGLTKDLLKGKMQTGIGYRYVDYTMPESNTSEIQNIAEANLFWIFAGKMSLGINYEGTFEKVNQYNRIYLQLRKRF
jgi:hypothetical protein